MAADARGTFVDRAYEAVLRLVAPRAAAVRAHHRRMSRDEDYAAAFHVAARVRGYSAAKTTKNSTEWLLASDRDADAELVGDHRVMRNRSRCLSRDNALASGIVATLRRGTVGTGLRPQARTVAGTTKDEVLEAVGLELLDRVDQANGLDHAAHQALVYQRTVEDGDVLLRAVTTDPSEPVWIEVIEGDRLAAPVDAKPMDPAGRIVAGVEKDRHGRTVAYWVAKRHPGDFGTVGTVMGTQAKIAPSITAVDYDRVDARGARFVRSRVTRPGQSRGVVLFHGCLQDLHDLELLILASLKRAQVAACLTLFLKSTDPSIDLLSLTADDYGYQMDAILRPGGIFRLFPGEDVQTVSPNFSAPDLAAFVFLLAQRIGAAVGLSPEAVLRAWKGVSYSGARTIKIDDRQTYRAERASFTSQVLAWEWRVVLEDALMRGDPRLLAAGVTPEDLALVEWIGDEEQWVDPQAEAAAVQLMLAMKLTSPQIECQRLGRDYADVLRQNLEAQALARDIRDELGLEDPVEAAASLQVIKGGKPDPDVADASEAA